LTSIPFNSSSTSSFVSFSPSEVRTISVLAPNHHTTARKKEGEGAGTISQLSNTNVPSHIFIKHLESANKLLGLAGLTEAIGAVQDLEEGLEIHCTLCKSALSYILREGKGGRTIGFDAAHELVDFAVCRVLSAGAKEVTE
jgi:hypothetical protein